MHTLTLHYHFFIITSHTLTLYILNLHTITLPTITFHSHFISRSLTSTHLHFYILICTPAPYTLPHLYMCTLIGTLSFCTPICSFSPGTHFILKDIFRTLLLFLEHSCAFVRDLIEVSPLAISIHVIRTNPSSKDTF